MSRMSSSSSTGCSDVAVALPPVPLLIPAAFPVPRPNPLLKSKTHGGEHNALWRTNRPIHARQEQPKHKRIPQPYAQSISTLQLQSSKLRTLSEHDFIVPDDIMISSGDCDETSPDDFDSEILGQGIQGTVFKGTLRDDPHTPFAIKCGDSIDILIEYCLIKQFSHPSTFGLMNFRIAMNSHRHLSLADIVSAIGFSFERNENGAQNLGASSSQLGNKNLSNSWTYMAVYEYCENGDLVSYLKRFPHKARDMRFITTLFSGLFSALAALHDKGYIHGDVKPDNVLIDSKGTPRLADFGMFAIFLRCTKDESDYLLFNICVIGMSQKISKRMRAQGTPSFLAPEVVVSWTSNSFQTFTGAADVFSLGAFAVYIITGQYPFRRVTHRLKQAHPFSALELGVQFSLSVSLLRDIEAVSPLAKSIIVSCLDIDPSERPSAADLACILTNS